MSFSELTRLIPAMLAVFFACSIVGMVYMAWQRARSDRARARGHQAVRRNPLGNIRVLGQRRFRDASGQARLARQELPSIAYRVLQNGEVVSDADRRARDREAMQAYRYDPDMRTKVARIYGDANAKKNREA